jgi:hypothetical protein
MKRTRFREHAHNGTPTLNETVREKLLDDSKEKSRNLLPSGCA